MTDKRVLTVANQLGSVGGTEIAQLAIFQGLAKDGWDVSLLYKSKGDYWPSWNELAISTDQVRSVLPNRSSPISSTIAAGQAAMIGRRDKPSIIYVHNAGDVPLALAMGAMRKVPVVAHLHLPPPSRQPKWLNAMLRRSAGVVAPSGDAASRWIESANLEPSKVAVIPTGIDTERFTPLQKPERDRVRLEIGVDPEALMILYVGRVERIKGVHFLVEAVSSLALPTRVVVCGALPDQEYREEILRACADGIEPLFLGRRTDIPQLMGASDLLVVPSNCLETQGLVVSEAMASGIPVVASDIGGLSESMSGFPDQLAPPADSKALATAIHRVALWRNNDPDLGDRSRRWVVEHNTSAATITAVETVLSQVAHRQPLSAQRV